MGFLNPTVPDVDPQEFLQRPVLDRIQYLSRFWADNGFGTPRVIHMIYLVKLAVFFTFGGFLVISLTTDVGSIWHVTSWWNEIVVYEKLILWTVLLEVLGVAGSWGPLAGHFKPMTGGARYWLRPGIIRLPPWPGKVPLTRGDERTLVDVLLYAALLVSTAVAVIVPEGANGMVRPGVLVPVIALLVVNGVRDKIVFLAARGEQYLPAIVFMATLGATDLVIALKLLIVVVWVGAGFSKIGEHFINVVPPMVSNAPFNPSKWVKRLHYRDVPNDLLPSRFAWFMAHVGGTFVEIVVPLTLLFTTNEKVALAGALFMVCFHLFIVSTFPLAVPLEWNVVFAFASVFLFVGHSAADGYAVTDFSQPWMLPVIAAALLFFPVLGNLRPDLVSFLPSMRQYAGNWASAVWAFAPGCEERLNELDKPAKNQVDQLVAFGYEPDAAEITMQITTGWRSLHSQGRGLYSLLLKHVPDLDSATVREAEFVCNSIVGWNFGDGHLHDEDLIFAVQRRLNFAPGELRVMYVESQPVHKKVQAYRVIDAAIGVVERGTWDVHDAVTTQPWLPNGPIALNVEWKLPGYAPAGANLNGVN
jgi:hypothetical protein